MLVEFTYDCRRIINFISAEIRSYNSIPERRNEIQNNILNFLNTLAENNDLYVLETLSENERAFMNEKFCIIPTNN